MMDKSTPAYLNGQFLPLSAVTISPLDRGFLFGDGIYEVIPAYGNQFLGLEGHLQRLDNSLAGVKIRNPYRTDEWSKILQTLIESEPAQDKKVYLQVTRGVQAVRNHDYEGTETPTVFAMCTPQAVVTDEEAEQGMRLSVQEEIRWKRCDLKTISLMPAILLKATATEQGAAEALIVSDGLVVECSSSNVFIVVDGEIHTPPTGNEILPGITRDIIIELAESLGIRVVERPIPLADVFDADEVWISSSTRGVVAVTNIDDNVVGNGSAGPIWKTMYTRYQRMLDELRNG